jgi:transcriptional regulator of arginine metabolism
MDKQKRHYAIRQILAHTPVANQDGLRRELRKQGFSVTQATLSRDLRDLGVGRVSSGEGAHYVLAPPPEAQILKPLIGTQVLEINASESLIVIRTLPACANVVAEYIDTLGSDDIIGTLAGDNTLLVIPRSLRKTSLVVHFLKDNLFQGHS